MAKELIVKLGHFALIATIIIAIPIVLSGGRDFYSVIDTPTKTRELAEKLNNLETNSTEQFRQIHWSLNRIEEKIDLIQDSGVSTNNTMPYQKNP